MAFWATPRHLAAYFPVPLPTFRNACAQAVSARRSASVRRSLTESQADAAASSAVKLLASRSFVSS